MSIHFVNSLDGWGVTETQIVRTNDGGITWYNVTPPNLTETGYSVTMDVLDNSRVWVHLPDYDNYPNSGTFHHTTDGGLNWNSATSPFSGGDIHFLDETNGWVLADLGVGAALLDVGEGLDDRGLTQDEVLLADRELVLDAPPLYGLDPLGRSVDGVDHGVGQAALAVLQAQDERGGVDL